MSQYLQYPTYRVDRRDRYGVRGIDDSNVENFGPMPLGGYNPDLEARFEANHI